MDVSISQLAATAYRAGVRLPFPFSDCSHLTDDDTARSADLDAWVRAVACPKYLVYAVHEWAGGVTDRVAAIESMDDTAFVLHVSGTDARLAPIGRDALSRTVVDALEAVGAFARGSLFDREVAVPARLLDEVDPDAVAAGLREARLPFGDVAGWLGAGRARATGVLGAIAYGPTGGRHVSRSITWRTYAEGGILAVELPNQSRRESSVSLRSLTARSVNRAAIDLLASLNVEMATAGTTTQGSTGGT